MSKNFKVGQIWETRGGNIRTIVELIRTDSVYAYPIRTKDGVYWYSYTRDGLFLLGGTGDYDLIKLVKDVPAPAPQLTWTPWAGGECPVPSGAACRIQRRNGDMSVGRACEFGWGKHKAQHRSFDIIAYIAYPDVAPYIPPEPDYSSWIGKVCWFWYDEKVQTELGVLDKVLPSGGFQIGGSRRIYDYCRPARPDELKFVEDK